MRSRRPIKGARLQPRGGIPRREERHGLAAPILDRPQPKKTSYGGFWLERSYPAPYTSEPRFDFVMQPLLWSVCTHHRHECLMRCAKVIAKAHRPHRRPPEECKPQGEGADGIARIIPCRMHLGNRPRHYGRDGRCNRRPVGVAIVLPPFPEGRESLCEEASCDGRSGH
jgi:hypothetical protein